MVGGEEFEFCSGMGGFNRAGVGEGFEAGGGVVEAVGGPGREGDTLVFWEAGEDGVGGGGGGWVAGTGWEGEGIGGNGMEEEKGEEEEHAGCIGRKRKGGITGSVLSCSLMFSPNAEPRPPECCTCCRIEKMRWDIRKLVLQ